MLFLFGATESSCWSKVFQTTVCLLAVTIAINASPTLAFNPYQDARQRARQALTLNQIPDARSWILEAIELSPASGLQTFTSQDQALIERFKDLNGQDSQRVVKTLTVPASPSHQGALIHSLQSHSNARVNLPPLSKNDPPDRDIPKTLLAFSKMVSHKMDRTVHQLLPPYQDATLLASPKIVLPSWETLNQSSLDNALNLLRQERYNQALSAYQALINRLPNARSEDAQALTLKAETVERLFTVYAGLAYRIFCVNQNSNPVNKPQVLLSWPQLADRLPGSMALSPVLQLCKVWIQLAQTGSVFSAASISSELQQELTRLSQQAEDLTAGLALWTLGNTQKASERLDAVDGESAQGYLAVVDRLMIAQAYQEALVMLQRGLEVKDDDRAAQTALQGWQNRLKAKRNQANSQVDLGNTLFAAKHYKEALTVYHGAQELSPEWDTPYLRLGETYERLDQDREAFSAYQQAIRITPALMDSRLFVKKYRRLEGKSNKLRK